jgi:hypothetical protein
MHGNHSNEHGSFRLAGKWDAEHTKLFVIEPSGKLNEITNSIIDLGEDPERTGPKGPKGFHVAQFTPKHEGVYIVLARQERSIQRPDGPKLRTLRNARSAFVALRDPRLAGAKEANGFSRTVALDDVLELVPVTNPLSVEQKGSLTLELLHRGKRSPNRIVTVVGQLAGPASAQDLETDERGRITVIVGAPDHYLARVKFEEEGKQPSGQSEKISYEATYVFQVFNRL